MEQPGLTSGETALLIDGSSDYIDFGFVLIRLGIRGNPPETPGPPSVADVEAAFSVLQGMSERGLVKVGHVEYDDGGPPGRLSPIHHVEDPLPVAKSAVLEACKKVGSDDWRWSCWTENTDAGSGLAKAFLDNR